MMATRFRAQLEDKQRGHNSHPYYWNILDLNIFVLFTWDFGLLLAGNF